MYFWIMGWFYLFLAKVYHVSENLTFLLNFLGPFFKFQGKRGGQPPYTDHKCKQGFFLIMWGKGPGPHIWGNFHSENHGTGKKNSEANIRSEENYIILKKIYKRKRPVNGPCYNKVKNPRNLWLYHHHITSPSGSDYEVSWITYQCIPLNWFFHLYLYQCLP